MCVAIAKPAGVVLDLDDLALAYTENGDGCGFTVRRGEHMLTRKGLWTFAEFARQWRPYAAEEALIHFRWASAGTVTRENCHPYEVLPGVSLIHNGHLTGYGTKDMSDTRDWIARVLRPLLERYPQFWTDAVLQQLVAASLGQSKIALLSAADGLCILPATSGHWDGATWYSQTGYRRPVRAAATPAGYDDRTSGRAATYDWGLGLETAIDVCTFCETSATTVSVCLACAGLADDPEMDE